jgi:hypothetical protein
MSVLIKELLRNLLLTVFSEETLVKPFHIVHFEKWSKFLHTTWGQYCKINHYCAESWGLFQ